MKIFDSVPELYNENVILRRITINDLEYLKKMIQNHEVYCYVPPAVPEKLCDSVEYFIQNLYKESFNIRTELILGIYSRKLNNQFCGILELYDYKNQQISVGYRIDKPYWNKGITTNALALIIDYLFKKTDINVVCSSNIVLNIASGRVLEKCGFFRINEGSIEDWGFDHEVVVNNWVLKKECEF